MYIGYAPSRNLNLDPAKQPQDGAEPGGKSAKPIQEALAFLQGKKALTSAVLVGLHRALMDPKLVAKVIAAHKKGAKLGAKTGGGDPKAIVKSAEFEWAPKGEEKAQQEAGGGGGGGGAKGGAEAAPSGDKKGGAEAGAKGEAKADAGKGGAEAGPKKDGGGAKAGAGGKGGDAEGAQGEGEEGAKKGDAGAGEKEVKAQAEGAVKEEDGKGAVDAKAEGATGKEGATEGATAGQGEPQGGGAATGGEAGAGASAKAGAKADGDQAGAGAKGDGAATAGGGAAEGGATGGAAEGGAAGASPDADAAAKADVKGASAATAAGEAAAAAKTGTPAATGGEGGATEAKGKGPAPGGKAPAAGKGGAGAKGPAPGAGKTGDAGGATGGGAPAPQPTSTGGVGRQPDGLVDHYMQTHWDDSEFYQKVATIGHFPGAMGSELDHWLPPTMSPSTRKTLNLVASVGGGIIDAALMSVAKAIPGAGLPFIFIDSIKAAAEVVSKYGDHGVNDPMARNLALVRVFADMMGNMAGNIADLCTIVADVCHGAATVTVGATEVVGIPVTAIGEIARGVAIGANAGKLVIDGILFFHNKEQANEAEAKGDFAKAGKYRDLMFGNVVDGVMDAIGLVMSVVNALTANVTGGGGVVQMTAKEFAGVATKVGEKASKDMLKNVGKGAAGGGLKGLGDKNPVKGGGAHNSGVGGAWANATGRIGLGDAMKVDPDGPLGAHFIQRPAIIPGYSEEAQTLNSARQRSVTDLTAGYQAISGDAPKWHQKLVNDLANPNPDMAQKFAEQLTPTAMIGNVLRSIRGFAGMLGDGSLSAVAGACDRAAGLLQSVLKPALDGVNKWIAKEKPGLEKMLEAWQKKLDDQHISLAKIQKLIGGAREMTTKISKLFETKGGIDQKADQIIQKIGGLQISRERLRVPKLIPDFIVNPIINKFNGFIRGLQGKAQGLKTDLLQKFDEKVKQASQWVQQKIAAFEQMFGEQSAFAKAMEAQFEKFKEMFRKGVEAFKKWDGVIDIDVTGAGAWLKEVAQRARKATTQGKEDRWKTEVVPEAQGKVNKWRADHGKQVEGQYHPTVPADEVAAANGVKQRLLTKIQQRLSQLGGGGANGGGADERQHLEQLRDQLSSIQVSGGTGKAAIMALWAAEDALARIAEDLNGVRPAAPAPTATPNPTPPPPGATGTPGPGGPPGGNTPKPTATPGAPSAD